MNKIIVAIVTVAVLLMGIVLLTDDMAMKGEDVDTARRTTIAVIMNGPRDDDGWGTAHFRAFESLRGELNLDIIYKENVPTDENCVPHVRAAIAEGARIVFATSFGFGAPICSISGEYPAVTFYHCTGIQETPNVATYMGRIYQMRYLSGIAAGMQTDTNHIGYVAAMPIDEVVRGINAFALGVRSVNPEGVVHVAWTDTWMNPRREAETAAALLDRHAIDVVAYHQDSDAVMQTAERRGISAIGYNLDKSDRFPKTALTAPIWNWAPFYRTAIRDVLENKFVSRHIWNGVETGIVDLAPLAPFAKPGIEQAIARERARLADGSWDVFFGPVFDNAGRLRVEEGRSMSDDMLRHDFKWFVTGVSIDEQEDVP